jgi:pilus assembly protein CpaE
VDPAMTSPGGYEIVRQLRSSPAASRVPVLLVTADSSVQERLRGFDAGADEVLVQPFAGEELLARVHALLRRAGTPAPETAATVTRAPDTCQVIAVHSLRGGAGATSLVVNLALAFRRLWEAQVLVLDLAPAAGQVAFYLDAPSQRTWAQLAGKDGDGALADELDWVIVHHPTGIDILAAPDSPPADGLDLDRVMAPAFDLMAGRYDYIVLDLPHDLGPTTHWALERADAIVVPVAPDVASIRAASVGIAFCREEGIPADRTRIVVNSQTARGGIPVADVERGLRERVELVIPYAPDSFLTAVNEGRPIMVGPADQVVASRIEDLACRLSHTRHLLDGEKQRTKVQGRTRERSGGRPWRPWNLAKLGARR